MPRHKTKVLVRDIPGDRLYNDEMVQRLINRVMRDGKKQLAERLVYNGMQKAADKLKVKNPLEVFEQINSVYHILVSNSEIGLHCTNYNKINST